MQSTVRSSLLIQRAASWAAKKYHENRVPLLTTLLLGFLAHAFAFTNKLLNSDEVQSLFGKGASLISGRWGLDILSRIFPDVSMPWIYGIITIALLAVAVCLLVHTLHLRSKWIQILAAGFVITFPSLTGTFSYMFTSSSYGVAFLLAVLAPWLLQKKSVWCWLGAILCMVFSLSIYQAYVSLTAGVLVLSLIRQLMDGDEPLPILGRGIAYVAFLILSMGLYYGITQLFLSVRSSELCEYASHSIDLKINEIPYKIQVAYKSFFDHFREDSIGLIPTVFSRKLHIALMAIAGVLLAFQLFRMRRKPLCVLLVVALVAIFPLAVNCIYLFILYWSIHSLVMYGFVSVYLMVFLLADETLTHPVQADFTDCARRLCLDITAIVSAVIIIVNIYIANESYLTLHMRYENTYAFYTSLISELNQSPEFTEGTRLAVIGSWVRPSFYNDKMTLSDKITGISGVTPDCYGREFFLRYYVGYDIPFASYAEEAEIAASPEFAEMPRYPYHGSIQKFGDIMVVKLS